MLCCCKRHIIRWSAIQLGVLYLPTHYYTPPPYFACLYVVPLSLLVYCTPLVDLRSLPSSPLYLNTASNSFGLNSVDHPGMDNEMFRVAVEGVLAQRRESVASSPRLGDAYTKVRIWCWFGLVRFGSVHAMTFYIVFPRVILQLDFSLFLQFEF